MNNKDLIKKLQATKLAQPDEAWVTRNREILLSQIKAQQQQPVEIFSKDGAKFTWQAVQLVFPMRFIYRTVSAVVLIFVLALGTSVTSAWADRSLPGDVLYTWKLTTERVQLTLTTSEQDKAKLNMEFAGKRIEEVRQLQERVDIAPEKTAANIKKTLEGYTENLTKAGSNLDALKNTKPEEAVKIATLLNQQVGVYSKTLKEDKEANAVTSSGIDLATLEAAINKSKEVSDQAVDVIVEKHQAGQRELTTEEVKQILTEKINQSKEEVNILDKKLEAIKTDVEKDTKTDEKVEAKTEGVSPAEVLTEVDSKTVAAKDSLVEAEKLLAAGDVVGSLQKVKESEQIVKEANDTVQVGLPPMIQKDGETIKGGVVDNVNAGEANVNSQPRTP